MKLPIFAENNEYMRKLGIVLAGILLFTAVCCVRHKPAKPDEPDYYIIMLQIIGFQARDFLQATIQARIYWETLTMC